jgi:hypothetical protein
MNPSGRLFRTAPLQRPSGRVLVFVATCVGLTMFNGPLRAECLDVSQPISVEGTLSIRIFAGSSLKRGAKGGDPELGYSLKLDNPICVLANDVPTTPNEMISNIQVFPDSTSEDVNTLAKDLQRTVGQRVHVEGNAIVGARAGQRPGALLLSITVIESP